MHSATFIAILAAAGAQAQATTVKTTTTSTAAVTVKAAAAVSSTSAPATQSPYVTTVSARGSVTVPNLQAQAPIASATASVDGWGTLQGYQVALQVPGAIGLCANNGVSTFRDDSGLTYSLICGFDPWGQSDIYDDYQPTWEDCANSCRSRTGCDSVVYAKGWNHCYYKSLGKQSAVKLTQNADRTFAYLPKAAPNGLSWPATITPVDCNVPGGYKTTTTVIAATGVVTIPQITATATVSNMTATIAAGTTLMIKANWMMGGGRRK